MCKSNQSPSGLMKETAQVWQAIGKCSHRPNPSAEPLTWTLKCVYLSTYVSPHFQISRHYRSCLRWQVHLHLMKSLNHTQRPEHRASYILFAPTFTSNYRAPRWMAGWCAGLCSFSVGWRCSSRQSEDDMSASIWKIAVIATKYGRWTVFIQHLGHRAYTQIIFLHC